jgi:hypothetical protein
MLRAFFAVNVLCLLTSWVGGCLESLAHLLHDAYCSMGKLTSTEVSLIDYD